MRSDVYQGITDQIVAELEKGFPTWHQPWNAGHMDGRVVLPLRHNVAAQTDLLAHCALLTLNAIQSPKQRLATEASAHADVLANVVGLDMTATWTPTVASYFGRVSRERIAEAVREGVSKEAAANIAGMKKAAMAEAAEQRLVGKDWLPELLRSGPAVTSEAEPAA